MLHCDLHELITKLLDNNNDLSKYKVSKSGHRWNSYKLWIDNTLYIIQNSIYEINYGNNIHKEEIENFYKSKNRILKIKLLIR